MYHDRNSRLITDLYTRHSTQRGIDYVVMYTYDCVIFAGISGITNWRPDVQGIYSERYKSGVGSKFQLLTDMLSLLKKMH